MHTRNWPSWRRSIFPSQVHRHLCGGVPAKSCCAAKLHRAAWNTAQAIPPITTSTRPMRSQVRVLQHLDGRCRPPSNRRGRNPGSMYVAPFRTRSKLDASACARIHSGLGTRRRSSWAWSATRPSIRSVTSRMSRSVSACLRWSWRSNSRSSSTVSSSDMDVHQRGVLRRSGVSGWQHAPLGAAARTPVECPRGQGLRGSAVVTNARVERTGQGGSALAPSAGRIAATRSAHSNNAATGTRLCSLVS